MDIVRKPIKHVGDKDGDSGSLAAPEVTASFWHAPLSRSLEIRITYVSRWRLTLLQREKFVRVKVPVALWKQGHFASAACCL